MSIVAKTQGSDSLINTVGLAGEATKAVAFSILQNK